ncbi:PRC-barrel domain-containing protein [Dongia sedimenti]|uniref:PRC-barrel domain-containing protein n=1 Tax=Dongia sedimenti TaxID=3064282 RepID=A0ABU0YQR2_9PROT|nr:PRC-barrel domain-containing protein [Rhodospirillaceae bacterium R-7]
MKRLLMTTAAASLLAIGASAYAQDSNTGASGQSQQPPVVTPPASNESGGTTDMNNPAQPPAADQSTAPATPAPAPAAEAVPANPPPSDAVISAQSDGEIRADQVIGMTVYNAEGEKVGTVHDILLDKEGKATGVVLSVGGVLGVGAKSVGLTWKEIDVNPEQQQVQISYTKDQLEAAPDFKTTEQINSEMNAAAPPAPAAPAGTTGTGGTTTQP